jgi:hypothetical protein
MHDAIEICRAFYNAYNAMPLAPYITGLACTLLAVNALLNFTDSGRY